MKDPITIGLYRLFWKSGGNSLASVYMTSDGTLMMAPTNWVAPGPVHGNEWAEIERFERLPNASIAAAPAPKYPEALRKMTPDEVRDMLDYDADAVVKTMQDWGFCEMPAEVDADEEAADKVLTQYQYDTGASYSGRLHDMARGLALAAIRRGRALEREHAGEGRG